MIKQVSIVLLIVTILAISCTKVDVTFGNEDSEGDPNISYFEDYPVELATYKFDSFVTSSHNVFTIGHHTDADFGAITSGSYAEINLLSENTVRDKNVLFDSIVIILKPNGNYYGDTLAPFKINVHRLTENIENEEEENTDYYNPRKFHYNPVPLGQTTVPVKPKRGTAIKIRLADTFGQDLLMKLRNNDDSIREQSTFLDYFKGLYFESDATVSNAMYYFVPDSAGMIMRLHYKQNNAIWEQKYLDFTINATKQFNNIAFNHTGTGLSAFTPFKTQLKSSSLTGNKAFLHTNVPSYVKISFPSILNLKELHPYIRVMKAELVIKPSASTHAYPYSLPGVLNLFVTDENNRLISQLADINGEAALTGNLFVDDLYGEKTQYTFDITQMISNLIAEGKFSTDALMLTTSSGVSDSQTDRLTINDQTLGKNIQLKLYLLGL